MYPDKLYCTAARDLLMAACAVSSDSTCPRYLLQCCLIPTSSGSFVDTALMQTHPFLKPNHASTATCPFVRLLACLHVSVRLCVYLPTCTPATCAPATTVLQLVPALHGNKGWP